jgi:hypothetical protein
MTDYDQHHPITPPDDLQEQWKQEWLSVRPAMTPITQWMVTKSAQWGADQELDACCEWLDNYLLAPKGAQLRAARRPKPPSLKEQALEALKHAEEGWRPVPADCEIIRRALEALDD